MTKVLAVAARELRERWLLFPAALAIGCVPLVMPAFGVPRSAAPVVGMMSAILLGGIAGLVIGSSMLTRDNARPLGFLFSRPLPSAAIWSGKWVAAIVLVTVAGLLAAVPWMTVYPPETKSSWLATMDGPGTVFVLLLAALVVGLANLGATLFRSRSPWLVFDVLALSASLWAIARYVAPLYVVGLFTRDAWVTALTPAPIVIGLVAGSAAQIAVGRTDLRRAHLALSLVVWAVVFAALAGAAGWLAWIEAAGPADLRSYGVVEASGRWLYADGEISRARWFGAGFLIDNSTGNYFQTTPTLSTLARSAVWGRPASFSQQVSVSADGRFAGYWMPDTARGSTALVRVDLSTEGLRVQHIGLEATPPPGWWTVVALSATAAHAVLVHDAAASVHELPSGRAVRNCPLPPGWRAIAIRFLGEDAARVWLRPRSGLPSPGAGEEFRVVDVGGAGGCRTASFTVAPPPNAPVGRNTVLTVDASGGRLLTSGDGLVLRDGATGALLATLVERGNVPSARFLSDGRIAAITIDAPGSVLRVFTAEGQPTTAASIARETASLGAEIAAGRVVVALGVPLWTSHGSVIVDATDGRIVQRLDDLTPVLKRWWLGDFMPGPDPSAVHVGYFTDSQGRLVRLDANTGERRVVAGPGAPRGHRLD